MAYTRLTVDERRHRLLGAGAELFARQAYDEVSMADIARAAGISKALLYHYFPSKRDLFVTTLQEKASELAERTEAAVRLAPPAPLSQVEGGLEAFLGWVGENSVAYRKLLRSAGIPEVREVVEEVREQTARRIGEGLGIEPAAARAWLWLLDGAILGWLERAEIDRERVREIALGALRGMV